MPTPVRLGTAIGKDGWPRAGLFLCAACLFAGCNRPNPAHEPKAPPAVVKWQAAQHGPLEEWIELAGATTPLPDRIARVSAPVEGRVMSVLSDVADKPIAEGQLVAKGTVIAQLDATVVQANLAKAEAAQEVLREEEQQAKFAVELAVSEVDRLVKLKAEEDRRSGNRTQLVSPVDRLKADYALKDARSKLKAATGKLAAGAKEIESLRAQLKLHTLTAPIAGHIGRIQVVRGQTLAVGAMVAEITNLDEQIDVLCFAPPSLIGRLRVGQPARIGGFEVSSDTDAEGRVEFIADQAEPETGNFAVKVRFANQLAHLKANRVTRIRVRTQPARECFSLPESAVQEDEEQPTVVVVTKEQRENDKGEMETVFIAHRLQAELGVRDRLRHQIEIVRLNDSEKDPAKKWHGEVKDAQFIVEGGQGLQSGDEVKQEAEGE